MQKIIKLTQKGISSGPNYELYYSTNGTTFIYSETIYLPYVDSEVVITIPDGSIAVKLVSIGFCSNSLAENIPNVLSGDFAQDFDQLDFN